MDTTKAITHISLCAGYGGIDIGLGRAIPSLRTIAFSEIEAFACANLVAKMEAGLMDAAPIWTNLKTFPWDEFRGKVDILSGGYPCQPFSAAGKRAGKDDPRHLWPYIADGIRICRPSLCFFENVEGHISLGLSDVIEDLARMGYRSTWGIFSAAEVGAPHQRKRVFILAHRKSYNEWRKFKCCRSQWHINQGLEKGLQVGGLCGDAWPSRPGEPQHGWEPPRVVGNAAKLQCNVSDNHAGVCERSEEAPESGDASGESVGDAQSQRPATQRAEHEGLGGQLCAASAGDEAMGQPANGNTSGHSLQLRPGQAQHRGSSGSVDQRWRQTQPPLGRDADGTANRLDHAELHVSSDNRTDELRLLGNGVVPATAHKAFITLFEELTNTTTQ